MNYGLLLQVAPGEGPHHEGAPVVRGLDLVMDVAVDGVDVARPKVVVEFDKSTLPVYLACAFVRGLVGCRDACLAGDVQDDDPLTGAEERREVAMEDVGRGHLALVLASLQRVVYVPHLRVVDFRVGSFLAAELAAQPVDESGAERRDHRHAVDCDLRGPQERYPRTSPVLAVDKRTATREVVCAVEDDDGVPSETICARVLRLFIPGPLDNPLELSL
mmetsp:Transcript_20980/g.67585  ORF Transcript_20980/g.67585 Transcript_20980/m.67585 type:complete len:218 (+) Transcript_20980:105-758(+)